MAYVDLAWYKSTYLGDASVGDTELARLLLRASDDITLQCPMALKDGGGELIDTSILTPRQLTLLKKSVCAQIEWYAKNGDDYNDSQEVGGESIGSYSRQTNLTQNKRPGSLSPRASAYLEQSGLSSRAVPILRRGDW
jgi:hypothetical protein